MKKTIKRGVMISVIVVLVFALSTVVAFAATNTSSIEELFMAFRSAQVDAAVQSGDMTSEEGDDYLTNLTEKMEESETDAVPPLNMKGGMSGMKDGERGMDGMGATHLGDAADLYADVSGMSADDIQNALKEGDMTIFRMADDAELLHELKAAMLDASEARIDEMLEAGKITDKQAADMSAKAEETISAITADTQMGSQSGGMRPEGQGRPSRPMGSDCDDNCNEA